MIKMNNITLQNIFMQIHSQYSKTFFKNRNNLLAQMKYLKELNPKITNSINNITILFQNSLTPQILTLLINFLYNLHLTKSIIYLKGKDTQQTCRILLHKIFIISQINKIIKSNTKILFRMSKN